MRCHICNAQLSPEEIAYNHDHDEFEPCGNCLRIISEVFEDGLTEEEIAQALEKELRVFLWGEEPETVPLEELENSS